MSLQNVKAYFKKYNLDNKIIISKTSTKTVKEAAESLSIKEGEVAKTLSFLIDEEPILILTSGDSKIDNKKYRNTFHKKAKMIPIDELEEKIGHEAGGICPFAIKDGVKVYLDETLKQYKYVYPACGSSNSAIKLSIDELEKYSKIKKWVDVCKDNKEE